MRGALQKGVVRVQARYLKSVCPCSRGIIAVWADFRRIAVTKIRLIVRDVEGSGRGIGAKQMVIGTVRAEDCFRVGGSSYVDAAA